MKITKRSTIGIIGGRGRTGGQFARLFKTHGYSVRVTGTDNAEKNSEIIANADVVIFALPLSSAADLMRAILKDARRKDQLILDLSSLKVREVDAMLTAKSEVIGMHPLFGPATDPKGERMILCPARATKETLASLRSFLQGLGIKTAVMTPEEHDRLMSVVQVIPHLKSFLMADVLTSQKTDFARVLSLCTPTYEMEFNVIARFLDDHPDLYMPIIFRNPETPRILRRLRDAVDACLSIAESGDLPAAERRYQACKKLFSPHLSRARRHSEACIRTLLSLTR